MADEVRHFACVVNTGSTPASPQTIQMQMPDRVVDRIEVDVPPGPKGSVGFYVASSNSQVVPFTAQPPLFVVSDDRVWAWDLTNQPTSGDWQLVAYNQGNYSHTLRVTFSLRLTQAPSLLDKLATILPAAQLSS